MNRETAGFKVVAQLGAYGGVGEKRLVLLCGSTTREREHPHLLMG